MNLDEVKRAIVMVGEGRGFVVQGEDSRFVISAGHCLPRLPPCISFSDSGEHQTHSQSERAFP
jgi:hypothetical protein